ncbi:MULTISPECIES: hypothetical protein [unclassified Corallococcus]|uniref:hypothetical protein n=1 Tax=unclassified Corallococcus TaxID=2685029 RepID=UPI001A8E1887|nr:MULTISPECIES: hypothetical protein [unclassified Corallococcus]MBN9684436.1 hypothetical protein [Corallococcus sp. NCSPR001]WAS84087.1 hypothetical protein O0N60_32925 [Corallococcus sp. NCRR]
MLQRARIASSFLVLGLLGGVGCGPMEEPPAPQEKDEGRTVTAMSTTALSWSDFGKTTVKYEAECVTGAYDHTCEFCGTNSLYSAEYALSECTSNSDTGHFCQTCDREIREKVAYAELPDGDVILAEVEHNVAGSEIIEFRLNSGSSVTWWKQVALVGGGDDWRVWNQDGGSWCNWPNASTNNCDTNSQWADIVTAPGTRFIFSKAKLFGVHTEMYSLGGLGDHLTGGDRVTFRWIRD